MKDEEVYEGTIQTGVATQEDFSLVATARERGLMESMFELAQRYPRDIAQATDRATALATLDQASAAECFYALNRGGKPIIGPSVRMAEILHAAWGRISVSTRTVEVGKTDITVEGRAIDMTSLAMTSSEVTRRITDKYGRRYSEDMIAVTKNAAQAIARRNAILQLIPVPVRRKVEMAARAVAHGDARTLAERRATAVKSILGLGVTEDRLLAVLERPSVAEVTPDDLLILGSLYKQATEEKKDLEILFPDPNRGPDPVGAKAKAASAQEALAAPAASAEPQSDVLFDPATKKKGGSQ